MLARVLLCAHKQLQGNWGGGGDKRLQRCIHVQLPGVMIKENENTHTHTHTNTHTHRRTDRV